MKHSPGPWTAKPAKLNTKDTLFYRADVVNRGIRVAQVAGVGEESANANAQLIAAAPELLEACKKAKSYLINHPDNWNTETLRILYVAIKKTEVKNAV